MSSRAPLASSLGIAIGVTVLSTGIKNRRSLYTALTVAALGVALYIPMQWVFYWLTDVMNWFIVSRCRTVMTDAPDGAVTARMSAAAASSDSRPSSARNPMASDVNVFDAE